MLSDDPYPPKKLCRHVLKELSYARAQYMYLLDILAAYVIVDNLLDDSKEYDHLSLLEEEIFSLLLIASAMWDSYRVRPYSLRYKRKLDSLIKRLERDLDCVALLSHAVVADVDILNTLVVGEDYLALSDIAPVPHDTPLYYRWQKN